MLGCAQYQRSKTVTFRGNMNVDIRKDDMTSLIQNKQGKATIVFWIMAPLSNKRFN